jgi:hypothetical protein
MLDHNRRESARDSRCMHASLEQDARLPKLEVSGVDTTAHNILGLISFRLIVVNRTK